MRSSPIQLIETVLEHIRVTPNDKYDEKTAADTSLEDVTLQFRFECKQLKDYWAGERQRTPNGMENNTFRVLIGVRTPPESKDTPYTFEVVCSGIVGCWKEKVSDKLPSAVAAEEYGYAMLYGMAREQILALTSRMRFGSRMLPTLSFMGHVEAIEKGRLKAAKELAEVPVSAVSADGGGKESE